MTPSKTHCLVIEGKKLTWKVEILWEASRNLEAFSFDFSEAIDFDQDYWFGDKHKPTLNKILEHSEKINKADLSYPIILSEDGVVMDGLHRICKAQLAGLKTIQAVQFKTNPPPDLVEDI